MTTHNEAATAHRNAAKAWRDVANAHARALIKGTQDGPNTDEADAATEAASAATEDCDYQCPEAVEHAAFAAGEADGYYEHAGHGTEGEDAPDHAEAEEAAIRVAKEHDAAAEQHEAYDTTMAYGEDPHNDKGE